MNPTKVDLDIQSLVLGGDPQYQTKTIAQDANGVLLAGTVMGIITDGGSLKKCDSDSVDGSAVAQYILVKSVDATAGPVSGVKCLKTGKVNGTKLIFGGDDDLADHYEELVTNGITPITGQALQAYDN